MTPLFRESVTQVLTLIVAVTAIYLLGNSISVLPPPSPSPSPSPPSPSPSPDQPCALALPVHQKRLATYQNFLLFTVIGSLIFLATVKVAADSKATTEAAAAASEGALYVAARYASDDAKHESERAQLELKLAQAWTRALRKGVHAAQASIDEVGKAIFAVATVDAAAQAADRAVVAVCEAVPTTSNVSETVAASTLSTDLVNQAEALGDFAKQALSGHSAATLQALSVSASDAFSTVNNLYHSATGALQTAEKKAKKAKENATRKVKAAEAVKAAMPPKGMARLGKFSRMVLRTCFSIGLIFSFVSCVLAMRIFHEALHFEIGCFSREVTALETSATVVFSFIGILFHLVFLYVAVRSN